MRVAYSGARRPQPNWPQAMQDLFERLDEDVVHDVMQLPPGTVVVHGGEPTGAEASAGSAARELGLVEEVHAPDLAAHGGDFAAAALARNAYVTTVGADGEARFFAAPWSKGTWDAWRKAEQAGVPRVLRNYLRDGGVRVYRWPPGPPAPPRVRSGMLRGYTGPGRLDVTRGSARGPGEAFAPTRLLLDPAIEQRHAAIELMRQADRVRTRSTLFLEADRLEAEEILRQAWALEDETWNAYRLAFIAEMRVSAGLSPRSPRWGALEEAAVARGVVPRPEVWRAFSEGKLGSYDTDGAVLTVACCWCEPPFRAHCHTRILCELWAKMGAEDGGEAKSTGFAIVCR